MPTNVKRQSRKPMRDLEAAIPADLIAYLRVGPLLFKRPAGERPSDLYGCVVYFWGAEESLAWLEDAWRRHEKLIRRGVDGEPYILQKMQRLRSFINAEEHFHADE